MSLRENLRDLRAASCFEFGATMFLYADDVSIISRMTAPRFLFYISFTYFAVLNVVTGRMTSQGL